MATQTRERTAHARTSVNRSLPSSLAKAVCARIGAQVPPSHDRPAVRDVIAWKRDRGRVGVCRTPEPAKAHSQLTVRALAAGLGIGTLLAFSNTYFGLQTGWVTMGSLQVRPSYQPGWECSLSLYKSVTQSDSLLPCSPRFWALVSSGFWKRI